MDLLIGNKIKEVRNIIGITQIDFAESIGISRGTLSVIEVNGQNPTFDQLIAIAKIYNIPSDYFLFNDKKLTAFVNDQLLKYKKVKDKYNFTANLSVVNDESEEYISKLLPLIPVEAVAGLPSGDVQVMEYDINSRYRIPEFNGKADFLVKVNGTSMSPKYYNGDILACKRIEELTFIQWGKVYVMDTSQGPLVKRLYKCKENKDCITCHSDNHEMYPDFEITKKDIRSISIVIGTIRLE
jgi:transcriptional regulator with XRE-family HTH domain